ncbi:DUF3307 domain-containing protein [Candidatus Pacearchaeota archaeon]|nr:DUF3307 domain-containing protein [Candidatus Pacearchaeota archaeon]
MKIFFLLLCVHALTDFQLQNGMMWQCKGRDCSRWYYWLTAHALICGGGVYLVTQCLALAIAEVACHWMIDFCKAEKCISLRTDQIFHVACRIAYVIILIGAANV